MPYSAPLTAFSQSVYLTIKGRHLDDIADSDGQEYIAQVVDAGNGWLDEIENAVDVLGNRVDFNFMRTMDFSFGAAALGDSTVVISDTDVLNVLSDAKRPLKITKAGQVVSRWQVVAPSQLGDSYSDMVAKVGNTLYFSRAFRDTESGGTITADVTKGIPRLSDSSDDAISQVIPRQLFVLGVAKNLSLPDIVQGGLSPSFVQKYNDLLQSAIISNKTSSSSNFQVSDDDGWIGGVY